MAHPECLRRLGDALTWTKHQGLEQRDDIARRFAVAEKALKSQLPPRGGFAFCYQDIIWEALLDYQLEIEASRPRVCAFREWFLSGMCARCQRLAFPPSEDDEDMAELSEDE